MNPKTLSLTSSFTPIHHLPHKKPISKTHKLYPGRVKPICKSQPDIEISVSIPGSQGTGPAAPTRGDIFLEKQQQIQSLVVEKKTKKIKKKELVKSVKSVTSSGGGYCCYGCGAPLQVVEIDAPGYVDPDTYQLVLLDFVFFSFF